MKKGAFWAFIYWVKPSFEGRDGAASYRRFTAFALGLLNAFLILADKLTPDDRINAFYANLVVISLIIGIVTTQNILSFFNKNDKNNDQNPGNYGNE